ncbi:hypothetical protein SODG_001979 [Sodalis praecaptivus]
MLKPDSLRAALTAAVPYVAQNPDCLHIFIDEGGLSARWRRPSRLNTSTP